MDDDAAAAEALRQLLSADEPVHSSENRASAKRKSKVKEKKSTTGRLKSAPVAKVKVARRVHKQPQAVEAIYNSEGELHLLDASTSIVYSTLRDKSGDLVPVGVYNRERQEIEFKEVEEKEADCLTTEHKIQGAQADAAPQPAQRIREELPALEFSSEPDDHCETALEAYEHIKPMLLRLCKDLKKDACDLRIYDPYYCTGKTKKFLSELGFTQVYNENEDFYKKLVLGSLPPHDCIITNPPFSGSHIQQLLQHCCTSGKPWLILMPTYVALKGYYKDLVLAAGKSKASHIHSPQTPFYVVPRKRYNYWTPKNVKRQNLKARKDGRTSPFVTMWFGQLHHLNEAILRAAQKESARKKVPVRLYQHLDDIPDGIVKKYSTSPQSSS